MIFTDRLKAGGYVKKQNTAKLSLFLSGLEERIADNRNYFKRITAVYKSGIKEFTADLTLYGDKLRLMFSGRTDMIDIDALAEKLSTIAENYEAVTVTYEERGQTIIIEADNKNVKMYTTNTKEDKTLKLHKEVSRIGNRDYIIKVGQADSLLKEIGIIGENGKIKNDMIRKYNQIDHFVELIDDMLQELAKKHETITVMDCGCGKSYLTFVLNYYIKEVMKKNCHFIGLDYSEHVIETSRKIAENLGYRNMDFITTDIKNYTSDKEIQLVISLHACDTATDEALGLAIKNNAKAIIAVPCCHREILSQYSYPPFKQILKNGVLKARIADALTDGMRALLLEALGYRVSVIEYVSPLETPKNIMIKAIKQHGVNSDLLEEYHRLAGELGIKHTLASILGLT